MSWLAVSLAAWWGPWAVIDGHTAILAVLGMAAVTYLSRASGLWIMAFVPLSRRVERGLKALSGSVLVALVVPAALAGDTGLQLGIAVAAALMALTGHSPASLVIGVAAAAGYRAVLG